VTTLETILPADRFHRCAAVAAATSRTPALTDADLVRRSQEGDLEAFEKLYRLHAGRVLGLCLRMLGDRDRAEELTQDVFVRVWKKLGTYRERSAFGSWLHRVTVNTVLSHFRASRRDRDAASLEEVPEAAEPDRRERPGDGVDLERAIAALPPRARLVFVLHEVQGHRHDEVASMMGISIGTSKAHLHRARAILRELLK
jgi:RNA polymerase sigma-70 factor (ECF subfamily)